MSRHNTIKIAPSILAADFARLGDDVVVAVQGGADYIHIDVMDGHFVPPITFGAQMIAAIKPYARVVPLVVHMMVEEPARHIEHIARAGADVIVVHAEACADLAATVATVRETGAQAGVAVRPETPIDPILPFLDEIAIALLMTVSPGYGGQPYIPEVETKIAAMRGIIDSRGLDVELEVDGGINEDTIEKAVRAGARLFVAGTAVYGRPEPVPERIKILRELAENALA